jgi:ABC-type amino acid transport system permease subunit
MKVTPLASLPETYSSSMTDFSVTLLVSYFSLLLWSARVTISVSILAFLFAAPLGFLITTMRLSRFALLRTVSLLYVDAVRGTPLLIQLLIVS